MANPNAKITVSLVDKTKAGFASIKKATAGARSALNKVGLAATAAAGGFAILTKSAFASTDSLAKLADAVGIGTEALAGYQLAASQNGITNEQLDVSFRKLANSVGEANLGLGTAAPAFKELGLDAQALARQNPDEQFKRIAEAISEVGNRSTQAALAQDIFGRQGTVLLNVLDDGRAGIVAYQKEAELLGLTISRFDASKVEQANDSFDKLGGIFTGFFRQVAVKLSPVLTGVVNDLRAVILESEGFQNAINKGFTFAVRAVGVFADAVRGLQVVFNGLKALAGTALTFITKGIGGVLSQLGKLSGNEGFKSAGAALTEFSNDLQNQTNGNIAKVKELSLAILPSEVIKTKVKEYQAFSSAIAAENARIAQSNAAGTPGGTTDALEKEKQRINSKFALLEAESQGELALNQAKQNAKLQQDILFLQSAETARIVGEQRANELVETLRQQHGEKMIALEQNTIDRLLSQQINYGDTAANVAQQLADRQQKIDSLSAAGKTQLAASAFGEALSIAAAGSKKIFKINQQLALADAVVNGFRAIQSGLATTPFFPVGIALGALAAVKTAAQIQGIRATKFSGGGPKPTSPGGGSAPSSGSSSTQSAPTVQGPVIEQKKAQIIVTGELDEREKTLNFANRLVELTRDGFSDLEIVLNGAR